MKNFGTMIAAVFLAAVLLTYMCTFQVRFTEVAILKTFGKPAEEAIREPGLKLKWPWPIQREVVFDKRTRVMEDRTEETRTIDGKNVLITTFTLWRINDPVKYHMNFPHDLTDVDEGEKKLRTTVQSEKHAVVGKRSFAEFVSTDPTKRHIKEIEDAIRERVADVASESYGIEVVGFGLKKLGLPKATTSAIFEKMKTNEQKKAGSYKAEGAARANDIIASAKAAEDRIMAVAQQKVEEIRTETERVVNAYYREFDEHQELRIFLDKLRTIKQALKRRTTLILDINQSPFDVFAEPVRLELAKSVEGSTGAASQEESTPSED